ARAVFGTALGGVGLALPVFSIIALFIGGYLIYMTLSSVIAQRVTEYGTLRAIGTTRRQVMSAVRAEALALGTAATVVGLLLGGLLAIPLTRLLNHMAGLDAGIRVPPRGILTCIVLGIGGAVLAALSPARRAA